ncbi:hypothetical protein MP228_012582 [Amoeboaphelidium protococcarum]|nr:hypothetical protein MP228_012582 [Amoeboaphelidium protococcarum]
MKKRRRLLSIGTGVEIKQMFEFRHMEFNRMCGTSMKDRRMLEPFPIVQVKRFFTDRRQLADIAGSLDNDSEDLEFNDADHPQLILKVALYDAHGQQDFRFSKYKKARQQVSTSGEEQSQFEQKSVYLERLFGNQVASSHTLSVPPVKDMRALLQDRKNGCYFVFNDLSVRDAGQYKLKFTLFDLSKLSLNILLPSTSQMDQSETGSSELASMFSETFTCYNQRDFPGILESTELCRWLCMHNIRVPIRNSD